MFVKMKWDLFGQQKIKLKEKFNFVKFLELHVKSISVKTMYWMYFIQRRLIKSQDNYILLSVDKWAN